MSKHKPKLILLLILTICFSCFSILVVKAEGTTNQPGEIQLDRLGDYSFSPKQFGYWYGNSDWNRSTDTEMIHETSYASPSVGFPQNGEFFLNMRLSDNFAMAAKNGFLRVDASASMRTKKDGAFNSADWLFMYLENGTYSNLSSSGITNISSTAKKDDFWPTSYEAVSLNLSGALNGNGLRMRMRVELGGAGGYTTLYAKDARLKLSTTDSQAPTVIGTQISSNAFSNQNKILKVDASDIAGSGVHYIEVNGKKYYPASSESNTQKATFNVSVENNGTYEIYAYDNVGNKSAKATYTESKIDKDAPSAPTVSINNEGNKTKDVAVNVDYFDNGISPSKVYYTLDKTIPTIKSNTLKIGQNILTLKGGLQTVTVAAIDEAGNVSEVKRYTVDVYREPLDVSNVKIEYYCTGSAIDLEFLSNELKENLTVETYLNGIQTPLVGVGEYRVVISVDNENFIGSYAFTVKVIKQTLSIELLSNSLVYNGQNQTVSIKNPVEGVNYVISMPDAKNTGVYSGSVTVSDDNFEGQLEFQLTITPAPLFVMANRAAKTYKEEDVSLTYQTQGLFDGDVLNGSLAREQGENAGEYRILLGSLSNENYVIEYTQNTFFINKAKTKVVAVKNEKLYGDKDPAITFLSDCNELIGNVKRQTGENAGTYAIELGTLSSRNYAIEFVSADFVIQKRDVTIVASGKKKIYGEADPTFDYQATGLLSGDAFLGMLSRQAGENAGVYDITLGTLANQNYTIFFQSATLTIEKKLAVVTPQNTSKVYGDKDPVLAYTVQGLLEGDVLEGTLLRQEGEDAGSYSILIGTLLSQNYFIECETASFEILLRDLLISAESLQKTYGENDPEFSYTASGLLEGDQILGELLREMGEDRGSYAIDQGTLSAKNYQILFESGTLTVLPRKVTVKAQPVSKVYNEQEKELTYTVIGLLEGDVLNGTLERVAGENAGEYSILPGSLSHKNYEIEAFETAVFTIEKAAPVLSVEDLSVEYTGSAVKNFTVHNPLNLSYVVRIYQDGNRVAKALEVGVYEIELYTDGDRNHTEFFSERATLTITEKQVAPPPVEEEKPPVEEEQPPKNDDDKFGGDFSQNQQQIQNGSSNTGLVVGLSAGGGVLTLSGVGTIFMLKRRRSGK